MTYVQSWIGLLNHQSDGQKLNQKKKILLTQIQTRGYRADRSTEHAWSYIEAQCPPYVRPVLRRASTYVCGAWYSVLN